MNEQVSEQVGQRTFKFVYRDGDGRMPKATDLHALSSVQDCVLQGIPIEIRDYSQKSTRGELSVNNLAKHTGLFGARLHALPDHTGRFDTRFGMI